MYIYLYYINVCILRIRKPTLLGIQENPKTVSLKKKLEVKNDKRQTNVIVIVKSIMFTSNICLM